jgi:glucose-6-phosphate 1-dehydrogenase
MEKPQEFTAEEIQKEKRKLLKSARIEKMVRGQYEEGIVNGEKVPGYRQEKGVDPHSEVETFAALQLFIDNERWAGVPFTIEAGKRLSEKNTEVTIQFKSSHQITFQIQSSGEYEALLLEALQGQRTQFVSYEEIDAAWELLEPALKERKLFTYPAGSSAKKLTQTMLS